MAKKPKITAEDFESWRGNAITQAVMERLGEHAEEAKASWVAQLSSTIHTEPLLLAFLQVELKTRLEVIEDIQAIQIGDIAEEENADSRDDRIGRIAAQAAAQAKGRTH